MSSLTIFIAFLPLFYEEVCDFFIINNISNPYFNDSFFIFIEPESFSYEKECIEESVGVETELVFKRASLEPDFFYRRTKLSFLVLLSFLKFWHVVIIFAYVLLTFSLFITRKTLSFDILSSLLQTLIFFLFFSLLFFLPEVKGFFLFFFK